MPIHTLAQRRAHSPIRLPDSQSRALALFLTICTCLAGPSTAQQPDKVFREHTGPVYSLAFSPKGDLLVSGGADRTIHFWRLSQPPSESVLRASRQQQIEKLDDDQYDVRQQAFIELAAQGDSIETDLQHALTVTASAEVRLRIGHLLAMLSIPTGVGHEGEVRSVAFSGDGKTVASAGRDNMVLLWSASSGRVQSVVRGHGDGAWCVAFSPDNLVLASGGGDQTIKLWQVATGKQICVFEGHSSTVHDLVFTPDGHMLASAGGFDKTIALWNLAERRRTAILQQHTDAVLCVAFSFDGQRLASSGYDGTLVLWDVASRRVVRSIETAGGVVRCVAFSPDGRLIATAEDARSVKIWEAATGDLKYTLGSHSDAVYAVVFSPNGRQLASAGRDGSIQHWTLPNVGS